MQAPFDDVDDIAARLGDRKDGDTVRSTVSGDKG